jgi:hypothetical protein
MPSRLGSETPFAPDNTAVSQSRTRGTQTAHNADAASNDPSKIAKLLRKSGEPRRNQTFNPQIKSPSPTRPVIAGSAFSYINLAYRADGGRRYLCVPRRKAPDGDGELRLTLNNEPLDGIGLVLGR